MGSMNINFADVEDSFQVMPEGLYPVVVEKVEIRESKSSDNPYLNWELTITDGEHEGRKLWQITSLSPKALFRLKDQFLALGVIEGDEEDFPIEWDDDISITPEAGPLLIEPEVTGMAATAVVTIDAYQGKDRNRVDELRGADEEEERPKAAAKKSAPKKSGGSNSASPKSGRRALR